MNRLYFILLLALFMALQDCKAQTDGGGVAQKSAQAHPDTEGDSIRKIDIHREGKVQGSATVYERGKASYYSQRAHGRRTASGQRHDKNAMICAHKRLPFGTLVRVVNERNKREVIVRVNDRGPFGAGRVIDLSYSAARELGMLAAGVVPVTLYVVE